MTKCKSHPGFKGHRFPPEIIEYTVWLYFRFSLSLRDVENILAERGITVSHETIRFWVGKFGVQYAKAIRRDRPPVGDKWHLDEVVISIRGKKHWLWRAVDQNGNSLEILVQSRRNTPAAKRFMRKLMKQYGAPRVMITPSRDIAAQCAPFGLVGQRISCAHTALQNVPWHRGWSIAATRV